MLRSFAAALTLLAFTSPLAATPRTMLPAQGAGAAVGDEPGAAVTAIAERAASADLTRIWPLAKELVDLANQAPDERKGVDPRWSTEILAAMKTAAPKAKLALGQALLEINGAEWGEVARAMVTVIEANGPEAPAAAAILGSRTGADDSKAAKEVSKKVEDLLVTGGLSAPARLAASQALWRIGAPAQRGLARNELLAFYRSDDADLRADAALALAAIDAVEEARGVLLELQKEPTPRGRLAKAFIQIEDERNLAQAKAEKQRRIREERPDASGPRKDAGDPTVLDEIMRMVRQRHIQGDQWTREELVAAAARGMLNELDPHSTFMTSQEFARMVQELNQVYAGIGAQVRMLQIGGARAFTIVRPFFSGPAYKAGIRAGDQVLAIITDEGGQRAEWSTAEKSEDEIIKRLKGKPGTKLTLKLARRGWTEPQERQLTREQIQIPLMESELLPGGVGYFDIQQFGREATHQLVDEVKQLRKEGLKAIVLDLRNNPGGYLDAAREMCEVFLERDKLVCYTEGREFKRQNVYTQKDPAVPDLPVVVLINAYSASASEITAGALQDHGRGLVVGERSFGKGSVQKMFEMQTMPDEPFTDVDGNGVHDEWEREFKDQNNNGKYDAGPRVKLTVERYFLPNGRSVNTEYDREQRRVRQGGIEPDVVVKGMEIPLSKTDDWDRLMNEQDTTTTGGAPAKVGAASKITAYVRAGLETNKALFTQLAVNDGKDPSRYPGFDELYKSLETKLDRNDVRQIVRLSLRDKVAEDRGKMFPGYRLLGDVEEDPQLREAIAVLLKKLNTTWEAVAEYKALTDRDRELGISLGPSADGTGSRTADARKNPNDEAR